MEENRKKSVVYKMENQEYNADSLAYRHSEEYEEHTKRYERILKGNRRNEKRNQQANGKINAGIDFISAAVLAVAVVALAFFMLRYLSVSSQIADMKKSVKNLNSTLSEMKSENDQAYSAVDASVDIGKVYDVAVGELGMVFPDEDHVVTYDYVEKGYVKQYQTVSGE
ncbi:MAG: hypothetical protein IKR27_06745 [Lachnospiraceae bacterium]|nr:hypothetical protein [Lachnospiraceae bacterium]